MKAFETITSKTKTPQLNGNNSLLLVKKNYKLVLWIFVLFAFNPAFSNSTIDAQQKAEKAYSEKNYPLAIQQYESILKSGLVSYKLYYNLGNAYYKNNELGKAIYNYELANKLQPNNQDIKNNLQIATEKTIDKIDSKENYFIGAIKSSIISMFSEKGWAIASIISLTMALTLFYIFFISHQIILKRLGFFGGVIFIGAFIISLTLGYSALKDKQEVKFAIILSQECKIFEEPIQSSKSKFSLHEGTKIKVLETNAEWTNIKLENGNEGWIPTSELGLL